MKLRKTPGYLICLKCALLQRFDVYFYERVKTVAHIKKHQPIIARGRFRWRLIYRYVGRE